MPTPTVSGAKRPALGSSLAVAFSLLSILVTAVLVLVSQRIAGEQVRSRIGGNLAELAFQTTSRLDRSMFERYREVALLAERLSGGDAEADVLADLEAVQRTYPLYAWIGMVDPAGKVRVATGGLLAGVDVSSRPWFREAQQNRRNVGDVHEAQLLARLLPGAAGGEPIRFVDIAFPLAWPASPAPGVLGVHLSWKWADEVRAAVFDPVTHSRSVEPLIVSDNGTVLLGPPDVQGRTLKVPSLEAARSGSGFTIEQWPDGREYLVGYSRDRGFSGYPGLGWRVLVRQDTALAFAPMRQLERHMLLWGVLVAAVFSGLGWWTARLVTRPLHELANAAGEVERGGMVLPVRQAAYLEVAQLGAALDSLVRNLRQKETALRELNVSLERRVDERTAALRETFEHVRENERRIQTILESSPDPFVGMDFQGRITDWNPRAEAMFGWRREEVLGRPLADVLLPPRFRSTLDKSLAMYRDSGQVPFAGHTMERIVVDRAGREIPVELRAGVIDTGKLKLFCAFIHDISGRREVERLKSEFVSTVSHELRTPLTSIYGSLRLLGAGAGGELPQQARQLLEMSTRSCERLIRLINDVLDVEKIASGGLELKREPVGVRGLLERALRDTQAYTQGLGVPVRLDAGSDPQVLADADRIIQVVVNLLSNAAKFSPPGDEVVLRAVQGAQDVRVSVVDHGAGIPAAFRDRVFDRFAQADASDRRQKGGTGLGLNICRSIVEAHGGTIGFESEPGVRTEFYFTLPLATRTVEAGA